MFAPVNVKTRRIKPKHTEWTPWDYQKRAVDFLLDRGAAALFLDPGLGKTSISLEAFKTLKEEGMAKHMLVIAPLRVCQLVWRQEGKKWTQFRDLTFSLLHGTKKGAALEKEADIYLINPEGIPWLVDQLWGAKWPFDTVVIDELTKFKNAMSVRHKKLLPFIKKAARRWGLTGTPIPNGYLDLFGQMKILDDGAALGFYYTHFRDKYFEKDYTGFNYDLRRGAQKGIEAAIRPYVLRMAAKDYLSLPKLIDDPIIVQMPPKARKIYNEMKKEMEVELAEGLVEAGNAAAVYSKLKQMANGAVYSGDGIFDKKKTIHVHDAKIDALLELIEEMNGQPIIIAYEFNHDLKRLQEVLGDVPFLGAGVSGKKAQRIEKDWNANRIPILLAHPASAGHGLNFQGGNACHIAWFSATWDYELYDQFIKRILRQGNKSTHVINHILIVDETIDNKTMDAIESKGLRQDAFCDALNAEIYHGGKTDALPNRANEEKDTTMVRKLSRRNKAEEPEEEDEDEVEETPSRRTRRSGRSSRRSREPEEEADEDEVEEKPSRSSRRSGSKRKLRGEDDADEEEAPVSKRARGKFSKAVRDRLDEEDERDEADEAADEDEAPRKRSTRKKSAKKADPEPEAEDDNSVLALALETIRTMLEEDELTANDLCSLSHTAIQLQQALYGG